MKAIFLLALLVVSPALADSIVISRPPEKIGYDQEVIVTLKGPYEGCHGIITEQHRYYFERDYTRFGIDLVTCPGRGPDYIDFFVHRDDLQFVVKE